MTKIRPFSWRFRLTGITWSRSGDSETRLNFSLLIRVSQVEWGTWYVYILTCIVTMKLVLNLQSKLSLKKAVRSIQLDVGPSWDNSISELSCGLVKEKWNEERMPYLSRKTDVTSRYSDPKSQRLSLKGRAHCSCKLKTLVEIDKDDLAQIFVGIWLLQY